MRRKILGSALSLLLTFYSVGLPVLVGLSAWEQLPSEKTVKETRELLTKPNRTLASRTVAQNKPVLDRGNSQPPVAPEFPKQERPEELQGIVNPAPVTQPKQSKNWEYQFQMLVRIISAEAKGEPLEGQVAVGAVILNRVASPKFPDTIAKNVLKPGEFEPVANGQIWSAPSKSAYQAARLAIQGWDPTHGALYFYNPAKTTSKWIWGRPVIKRIGGHVFAS